MKKLYPFYIVIMALCASVAFGSVAHAAKAVTPPQQEWSHKGLFGTYDRGALQRGFLVYKQVCSACHGMEQLAYRHLEGIGFTDAQIRALAADYRVMDGPNDEGEMFERPAVPSDRFVRPFPNPQAARFANNGAYPPDMSLIVKGRHYGEDYIYALLTGYTDAPDGVTLMPGMNWNEYFAGNQIAMANVLFDGAVEYTDGTEATKHQMARDVTQFLAWASEPKMEVRKQMGVKVILFLSIFAFIMYLVKRKVWSDIKN